MKRVTGRKSLAKFWKIVLNKIKRKWKNNRSEKIQRKQLCVD